MRDAPPCLPFNDVPGRTADGAGTGGKNWPVGSNRSALSALRPMGFSGSPTEPDVHLSLCIRLSKSTSEVRRPHPIEREPHHRNLAHLVLLNAALGPDPRAGTLPAGSAHLGVQLPTGGPCMFTPQPQPEPSPHIPVQKVQDALGPNAVAVEVAPSPEDWIDFPEHASQRPPVRPLIQHLLDPPAEVADRLLRDLDPASVARLRTGRTTWVPAFR